MKRVRLTAVLYVDDQIVTREANYCKKLRAHLQQFCTTKNLGALSSCTRCEYARGYYENASLKITQNACIDRLVVDFGVSGSNPIHAVRSVSLRPTRNREENFVGLCREGSRSRASLDCRCHPPQHLQHCPRGGPRGARPKRWELAGNRENNSVRERDARTRDSVQNVSCPSTGYFR